MRDRDWRRAQRLRAIARTARDHIHLKPAYYWGSDEQRHAAICRAAITPHPCSRYCCGNPRHHFDGPGRHTRQEHKWFLTSEEQEREEWQEWFGADYDK